MCDRLLSSQGEQPIRQELFVSVQEGVFGVNENLLEKKKNEGYATNEEYAFWIEQIRAGNRTDYYFSLIISSIKSYFSAIALSFARSTDYNKYEDFMQEGYLLLWKIIQIREFDSFFPYCTQSFRYLLISYYHQYMGDKLREYSYLMEKVGRVPWTKEYTQRLMDYSQRRRKCHQQYWLRKKEREELKRKKKEKNHENYLRYRDKTLAYLEKNRERCRENCRRYYREHREQILDQKRKYRRKNRKRIREHAREYRKEHPERVAESLKKYEETHAEARREAVRRYRAKNPRRLKKPGSKMRAPYGFRKGRSEIWVVNSRQDYVVRMIFDWYITGYSIDSIVMLLKAQRISSPSGKEYWASETVDRILKDERYTGKMTVRPGTPYGKNLDEEVILNNYLPVIVSENRFKAAQEMRKRRSENRYYKLKKIIADRPKRSGYT